MPGVPGQSDEPLVSERLVPGGAIPGGRSSAVVVERAARHGNGVARRIPGIGEFVPVALVNPAKLESVLGGAGAERVDVGHVEHQLGERLAALASRPRG